MEGWKCHYTLYTVVWSVFCLPVLDAELCEYYEKIFDMEWSEWDPSRDSGKSGSLLKYRIKKSTWYCSGDMYCCGRDCCHNYNYYDPDEGRGTYEVSSLSTYSLLGIIFGVGVASCLLLTCVVVYRKRNQQNRGTAMPMTVAYSDNGTAVVRQRSPDDTVPTIHDQQDTSPYSPSNVHTTSPRNIPESSVPQHEYGYSSTYSAKLDAPPPSYEDVMSHGISESK